MNDKKPIILKDFDPAELAKIESITKDCHELHMMPPPVLKVKLEVFDKDGNPISKYQDLSRSWVRNAYNFITMQTMGLAFGALGSTYEDGTTVMRKTNGGLEIETAYMASSRQPSNYYSGAHFRADAGVDSHGVVVGTGITAESFEHYYLVTPITNGTGAGQMEYGGMDAPGVSWDGGTRKFTETIERFINNNSGGSITVNEVGLVVKLYSGTGLSSLRADFMLARDLQDPAVTVPDTAQLKVTYTITSTAYPA